MTGFSAKYFDAVEDTVDAALYFSDGVLQRFAAFVGGLGRNLYLARTDQLGGAVQDFYALWL
ncbi:hypothetical protein D3C73_1574200 [compost metagenome]